MQKLAQAPSGSIIPIEFGSVDLSASCHSAILGPILEERVLRGFHGRFLMGDDTTGRNEWDADAGLKKESERLGRKLVCVWETAAGGVSLVGSADQQVRATHSFALEYWRSKEAGTTARELADEFRITIQAASNRLAKAASLGLLHTAEREPVSGGGTQYRFLPVA